MKILFDENFGKPLVEAMEPFTENLNSRKHGRCWSSGMILSLPMLSQKARVFPCAITISGARRCSGRNSDR